MVGRDLVPTVCKILRLILEKEKGMLIGRYVGRIYLSYIWMVVGVDKHVPVGDREILGEVKSLTRAVSKRMRREKKKTEEKEE